MESMSAIGIIPLRMKHFHYSQFVCLAFPVRTSFRERISLFHIPVLPPLQYIRSSCSPAHVDVTIDSSVLDLIHVIPTGLQTDPFSKPDSQPSLHFLIRVPFFISATT